MYVISVKNSNFQDIHHDETGANGTIKLARKLNFSQNPNKQNLFFRNKIHGTVDTLQTM